MNLHEKKSDKVAIVGMYPLTRDMCPFDNPDIEIWGMNDLYNYVPRVDVLFQVHNKVKIEEYARDAGHFGWLQKAKIPVYTMESYKEFPNAFVFPWRKLVSEYGDYFTNGVSWLLAFAIWMEYKEIQIYGVEMAHASEFTTQKPSVTYFIGLARGKGIKVWMPKECKLMYAPFLYGIENEDRWARVTNEKVVEYIQSSKKAEGEYLEKRDLMNFYKGKIAAYNEMRIL